MVGQYDIAHDQLESGECPLCGQSVDEYLSLSDEIRCERVVVDFAFARP
jgi:hypothetical protein